MERSILIRDACVADLAALTQIYNYYVVHSIATFDTRPCATEERQTWFNQFACTGPHRLLVAVQREDGRVERIMGYAYSARFRPKPAYSESVETTIYLASDACGLGLGDRLYSALFERLLNERVHRAYAVIALPNDASRALHLKHGFIPLQLLSEVGRKFDRYVDTEWFEKKLA